MAKSFSIKLAVTNIRQNRKFYLPYFFASVGTIMMFYIMSFLAFNKGISKMPGQEPLTMIMIFGCILIGIFAFIFLFYTNSFLMKRRKKEIGLYNILGMEKKHIGRILAIENGILGVFSIVAGLLCGILFSKLVFMIICKVMGFDTPIVFNVSGSGIVITAILFGIIFLLILIANQTSLRLAKPIELLQGGNVGEKEPKTKRIMAIIGAICLGTGYFIAITIKTPLTAITLFFVAVILVVIGTYCLFTAGSIAVLKGLRRNKKFYYKPNNFTAISGMIYRMKQNAVGLANICILSTMVLVMVSTTVCLQLGVKDTLNSMYPGEILITNTYKDIEQMNTDNQIDRIDKLAANKGRTLSNQKDVTYLAFKLGKVGRKYKLNTQNQETAKDSSDFTFVTAEQYKKLTNKKTTLENNEILVYSEDNTISDTLKIEDMKFKVKGNVKKPVGISTNVLGFGNIQYIVVSDNSVISELYHIQKEAYGKNANGIGRQYSFDLDGTSKEKVAFNSAIENHNKGTYEISTSRCRQDSELGYHNFVSGFLFLGIFLGIVFTFAAALIIYYKQISEGYYDKEKFEIMQKVGMSKDEVKKTIKKQVLMVFFVPLAMAGIHVSAAFNMISKMLRTFGLNNNVLFAICMIVTFAIFAVIYAAVYGITAREYYKIVEE